MFQQIMDEPGISQVGLDAAESRKEHGVMSHHQAQDTDTQDKDCVSQGRGLMTKGIFLCSIVIHS